MINMSNLTIELNWKLGNCELVHFFIANSLSEEVKIIIN